jgi:hypothetical protein
VAGTREKTYFEQQRAELIGEIAMVRIAHRPPPPAISTKSGRAGNATIDADWDAEEF